MPDAAIYVNFNGIPCYRQCRSSKKCSSFFPMVNFIQWYLWIPSGSKGLSKKKYETVKKHTINIYENISDSLSFELGVFLLSFTSKFICKLKVLFYHFYFFYFVWVFNKIQQWNRNRYYSLLTYIFRLTIYELCNPCIMCTLSPEPTYLPISCFPRP